LPFFFDFTRWAWYPPSPAIMAIEPARSTPSIPWVMATISRMVMLMMAMIEVMVMTFSPSVSEMMARLVYRRF